MLKETLLEHLPEKGKQLQVLTAFWTHLVLIELAHRLLFRDRTQKYRSQETIKQYDELHKVWTDQSGRTLNAEEHPDLAERILWLVSQVIDAFPVGESKNIGIFMSNIYRNKINILSHAISEYVERGDEMWLLFDNLDKGLPALGIKEEDIIIMRCLLEATRKVQQLLEQKNVNFRTVIFIRKDVYDHLISSIPDKGKDLSANLDWSDERLLEELLRSRLAKSASPSFEQVWNQYFDQHKDSEASFRYILSRTFLRPRDILNFVRKCINIAKSRGHKTVSSDDIDRAESEYSADMLNEAVYEIRDVYPEYDRLLKGFYNEGFIFSSEELWILFEDAGIQKDGFEGVQDVLLWFSFLGIETAGDERYSYNFAYNIEKLKALAKRAARDDRIYCIHPAFRKALSVE